MKRVVSLTRRAIEDYSMIEEGDKIAVGISGGKDSLVLAAALAELSRYYPKRSMILQLKTAATRLPWGITMMMFWKPFS